MKVAGDGQSDMDGGPVPGEKLPGPVTGRDEEQEPNYKWEPELRPDLELEPEPEPELEQEPEV